MLQTGDLCHSCQPDLLLRPRQAHVRPRRRRRELPCRPAVAAPARMSKRPGLGGSVQQAQQDVLESIASVEGRGKKGMTEESLAQFEQAVAVLNQQGGVKDPTRSGLLDGKWRLLFTTRPGSASPIQRAFVGVNAFTVYQEISLREGSDARVNNIVDFGRAVGQLKVEAEASTESRPRPGFTPRKGAGLPIFGKSENYPAATPNTRIDFQFDTAAFSFTRLPSWFKIPYPVPFKLLGDETKGWLDTTYLSSDGEFRISKGNKGTMFVLVREQTPKDALLAALTAKAPNAEVKGLIQELRDAEPGIPKPAQSSAFSGNWELLWDYSTKEAPALQKAVLGLTKAFQQATLQNGNGKITNVAQFPLGWSIRTLAQCTPEAPDRSAIQFDEFFVRAGPFRWTLPFKPEGVGYWTWLWLDEDLRVMEGSKGSMFIHRRIPNDAIKP